MANSDNDLQNFLDMEERSRLIAKAHKVTDQIIILKSVMELLFIFPLIVIFSYKAARYNIGWVIASLIISSIKIIFFLYNHFYSKTYLYSVDLISKMIDNFTFLIYIVGLIVSSIYLKRIVEKKKKQ